MSDQTVELSLEDVKNLEQALYELLSSEIIYFRSQRLRGQLKEGKKILSKALKDTIHTSTMPSKPVYRVEGTSDPSLTKSS